MTALSAIIPAGLLGYLLGVLSAKAYRGGQIWHLKNETRIIRGEREKERAARIRAEARLDSALDHISRTREGAA